MRKLIIFVLALFIAASAFSDARSKYDSLGYTGSIPFGYSIDGRHDTTAYRNDISSYLWFPNKSDMDLFVKTIFCQNPNKLPQEKFGGFGYDLYTKMVREGGYAIEVYWVTDEITGKQYAIALNYCTYN